MKYKYYVALTDQSGKHKRQEIQGCRTEDMNMEKYKFDERSGLWYELQGDYYLPCLKLSEKEQTNCKT